jgi:uncharacterized membrane protein
VPLVPPVFAALPVGAVDDNSAAYDLVLLAHVLSAVVSLVAVVVAGGFALALRGARRRGGSLPGAVVRYYRPGVNWVGHSLVLVPVFGVALVAMGGGQWSYADGWVSAGIGAWIVAAGAAEGLLWPAERSLQRVVGSEAGGADDDVPDPDGLCLRSGVLGIGLAVLLVAVAVLMVAKP